MSSGRECSFYQYPETLGVGGGIGYCDLVGEQTDKTFSSVALVGDSIRVFCFQIDPLSNIE